MSVHVRMNGLRPAGGYGALTFPSFKELPCAFR